MSMVLVNGEPCTAINISDRAFQYGDGLFETIPVRDGCIEYWARHMQRLLDGCRRLNLPLPDTSVLLDEVKQLARQDGVIKIIISRGDGGRGYRAPDPAVAKRIVAYYPLPQYAPELQQQGISLTVCQTPLGLNPVLAGMKHLNRLEQVVGRSEWNDDAIYEGLMLDINGHVVEGTMTNLFFAKAGRLYTPRIENSGVEGIMRQVVLACCEVSDIAVTQGEYGMDVLTAADELFVTNSVVGIWPVSMLMDVEYPVGQITQTLQQLVAEHKQQQGEYEKAY